VHTQHFHAGEDTITCCIAATARNYTHTFITRTTAEQQGSESEAWAMTRWQKNSIC